MFPSQYPKENGQSDEVCVTVTDEVGRSLTCSVEYSMEVEGQEYALLLPIDAPIEIFTWNEDDADDAAIPVEDEDEIDRIFETAKVVLQEQNLTLQRTAVTLTAAGELPEFPDEEDLADDQSGDGDSDYEELLWLASFYHEEQEYAIYTPFDPFFILARMNAGGEPELLSEEEFRRLEPMLPMLEDQFFDELD